MISELEGKCLDENHNRKRAAIHVVFVCPVEEAMRIQIRESNACRTDSNE